MALYRKHGTYWYDFWFRGEQYRGPTFLKNRALAKQIEAKVRTDLALGVFGLAAQKATPILKVFLEGKFLDEIKTESKAKPRTIAFYKEKTARLLEHPTLGNLRLHQIDADIIDEYRRWRSQQKRRSHGEGKVSIATVNGDLRALRHALKLAESWNMVNPPKVRLLPGEQGREFVLSYRMEATYLAVATYPLREAAIVMIDHGLRPEECVALRKEDVSIAPAYGAEIGYLRVTSGKTPNAKRTLSLTARSRETFELLFRLWPESPWVFPGRRKGKHLTVWALDNLHAELRRNTVGEDGEPIFPKECVVYSCRHTFGTRLGESGADANAIKKAMGHASVTMSEKYVHPTPGHMERVYKDKEAMDVFFRESMEVPTNLRKPTVKDS